MPWFVKVICSFGVLAVIVGWVTIAVAVAVNPWFSLEENALSDLGAINLRTNYIFNWGIAIAAILGIIYSVYLIMVFNEKLANVGSTILLIGVIHLLLIALYPKGMQPHMILSYEFFILTGITIALIGVSLLTSGKRAHGAISVTLSAMGFTLTPILPWPSIGAAEIFAITIITLWTIVMLHLHLRY